MSRRWVMTASPLIALCNASLIPVIKNLCDEIVIPAGVADEIKDRRLEDPARHWLRKCGHQYIVPVQTPDAVVMSWDLGKGETEVISYAHSHPGVEAILDDTMACACASALGVPVRGTLGVVLLAKKTGHIEAVKPVFQRLIEAGFHLSSEQINSALALAGELETE